MRTSKRSKVFKNLVFWVISENYLASLHFCAKKANFSQCRHKQLKRWLAWTVIVLSLSFWQKRLLQGTPQKGRSSEGDQHAQILKLYYSNNEKTCHLGYVQCSRVLRISAKKVETFSQHLFGPLYCTAHHATFKPTCVNLGNGFW